MSKLRCAAAHSGTGLSRPLPCSKVSLIELPSTRAQSGSTIVHKSVPSPPLVGIELNPGPPRKMRGAIEQALTTLGQTLGSSVARKSRRRAKKKKGIGQSVMMNSLTTTQQTMPLQMGFTNRSTPASHTPFILKGICNAFTIGVQTAGAGSNAAGIRLKNNAGILSNVACIDVDPVGSLAVQGDFRQFPNSVRNIALSFNRYRFRKLIAHYQPFVSTGFSGSLLMAASPETVNQNIVTGLDVIYGAEVKNQHPYWCGSSLDLLQRGGLRTEWLFLDTARPQDEANLRQESAGSLSFYSLGIPLLNSTEDYGQILYEYEIEFEGLGSAVAFEAPRAIPSTPPQQEAPGHAPPPTRDQSGWYAIPSNQVGPTTPLLRG